MDKFVKVKIRQDESSHWYVIPDSVDTSDWDELLYDSDDYGEAFENKYSKYRTGGALDLDHDFYIKEQINNE